MNWNELRQINKFTPINQLPFSKRLITDRPLYYLGNGFLISFTDKMFRVDGDERIEYGEEGEYALNIYFFQYRNELELYFKLNESLLEYDDVLGAGFEISEGIYVGSTFQEVNKLLRSNSNYQDGETRSLRNGAFRFQNLYISWGDYNFFFFKNSKKALLSGFQYTLQE
jgi:hypothetical protein